MLIKDLDTGVHLNETNNPEYFTTARFHTPNEIKVEIIESGLKFEKLIAVESFGWMIDELAEKLKDANYLRKFQKIIDKVEANEDLIAMSPHVIAVAGKE